MMNSEVQQFHYKIDAVHMHDGKRVYMIEISYETRAAARRGIMAILDARAVAREEQAQ